ncbi:MAG: site-specific DNA-methyltransferase [Candidatus Hodarchaeota archaeon]
MKWKGKKERNDFFQKISEIHPFHIVDTYPVPEMGLKSEKELPNLLIWGENKKVLKSLLNKFEKKISLIYIDPPFATGGDFNLKIQIGENGKSIDNLAYRDKWEEGLDSYLNFLYERLIIMKKLLTNTGSIYIHLDWHISHYVKLIMDEIFGHENFRNEIIWAYPAASVKTRRFFIRSYDTILFYSRSDDYIFNDDPNIYQEFSDRVKNALKKDNKGVFYYRGGSHNGKKLSRKVYVEKEGIFPRDLWSDIPYIRANTSEYQGFSTQKPERLLKRIILASTNKKDLVADFFCGSGTTLVVAEKLRRRWIGCDSNWQSIHITRKRILNIGKSNDILNWSKPYNKEYKSFKILSIDKKNEISLVPKVFWNENVSDQDIFTIKDISNIKLKIHQNKNEIKVELIDYKICFDELLSKEVKESVRSYSDWIDYWSVDFDNRDKDFRSIWFAYKTPKIRKICLISDPYYYKDPGDYMILIKTIDILGIETIKSFKIKII